MLHQMSMQHDKMVAHKENNPPSEPSSPSTIGPLDRVVNYVSLCMRTENP